MSKIVQGGGSFKRRRPGGLAKNNALNELADVMDGSLPLLGAGQTFNPIHGSIIVVANITGGYNGRTGLSLAKTFYNMPSLTNTPSGSASGVVGTNTFGSVSATSNLVVIDPGSLPNVAMVMLVGECDKKSLGIKLGGGGGNVSAFRVVKDGGVAGTNTANCSFTYSVYVSAGSSPTVAPTGTAIATSVAMAGSRMFDSVTYSTGHYGSGYFDLGVATSNNPQGVVLLWVDEKVGEDTSC